MNARSYVGMSALVAIFAAVFPVPDTVAEGRGVTYVIPIKGEIERGLVHTIRRGVADAERQAAAAIIIDMDTPGGRLDAAEDILHIITATRIKTYTFVNPNAISAGAIIAMGTDHIYMAPGGRIGDAMPIMMSPLPMGGPVELPDGLKEKAISPVEALIRSAAQRKGHDPELAAKMVRPEAEYKIGDRVFGEKGRLLTLTAKDAEEPVGDDRHPLLSSGTVADLDGLLARIGRMDDRVVVVSVNTPEKIARFVDSFPVSGLLLALGLLALYLEFKTPGFGLPGIAGILILAIWFWGHNIAGLAGFGDILLFMVGLVLVLAEVIFFPTMGVLGVVGAVVMTLALLMAMLGRAPGGPWYIPPAGQFVEAIKNLGLSLILSGAAVVALAKFLPKTPFGRDLLLAATIHSDPVNEALSNPSPLVGLKGTAITHLRPAGTGVFGEKRLDIVTQGDFIDQGQAIVIVEAHGNGIVVRRVEKLESDPVQG